MGALIIFEGAARGGIPETGGLAIEDDFAVGCDNVLAAGWARLLGAQVLPGLVQFANEIFDIFLAIDNRFLLSIIGLDDTFDREGNGPGQRLFAIEPLRFAGGNVDLQHQSAHNQGGRSTLDLFASLLEHIPEVAGELEGEGIQRFLRLSGKDVDRSVQGRHLRPVRSLVGA